MFPDADVLCANDASSDSLSLAASFLVGLHAAAESGLGVIVTSMDQMRVICVCIFRRKNLILLSCF
jgi:hypothetical protein